MRRFILLAVLVAAGNCVRAQSSNAMRLQSIKPKKEASRLCCTGNPSGFAEIVQRRFPSFDEKHSALLRQFPRNLATILTRLDWRGNLLRGNCRKTSLQRLCRSARRIHWHVAANTTAESQTQLNKTVRLCWTNAVTCGSSIRFSRSHTKYEWRVHHFGVRLMSKLYKHLNPMTLERALQTARKLADNLRAKGFGVANGIGEGSQTYKSSFAQARRRELQQLSSRNRAV